MPKQPQTFGEQAARFSLYAPVAAILIGIFTAANREQPGVAIVLAVINCLLILAGLIFGVIALLSIKRYGRQHILGRAIGGLVFNGIIIASLLTFLVPAVMAGRMKAKVAGRWLSRSNPPGITKMEVTFGKTGVFTLVSSAGDTTASSLEGQWGLTRNHMLGVTIDRVIVGNPSVTGKWIGLGIIQAVDDQHLVLRANNADETYTRE